MPPDICTFCCVRIHVLKSTQARQGRLREVSSTTSESGVGACVSVGAEAAASLRPAPRPRASVTRSSIASERAPPGRKEKRFPPPKRPRSLGAAILPAQCLLGQVGLQLGLQLGRQVGLQVGLQASARAAARARPQEPGARAAGSGAEAGPELGLRAGSGAEPGAGAGSAVEAVSVIEAGLGCATRTREEAEREDCVGSKDAPEARVGPEARVLETRLGLVPRSEPGLSCPWRRSRFLQ